MTAEIFKKNKWLNTTILQLLHLRTRGIREAESEAMHCRPHKLPKEISLRKLHAEIAAHVRLQR